VTYELKQDLTTVFLQELLCTSLPVVVKCLRKHPTCTTLTRRTEGSSRETPGRHIVSAVTDKETSCRTTDVTKKSDLEALVKEIEEKEDHVDMLCT